MKKSEITILIFTLFTCIGCDIIDIHPYDAQINDYTNLNNQHINQIASICKDKNQIRFAIISDTQRWYDETSDAIKNINSRNDIDFVIHCGDLTDFGATKEFEWMVRELEKLKVPYVCLIGNHDCLGNGIFVFQHIYGNPNFSFNAGNTHFLCLNTNALEFDYSNNIPDFYFIRANRESLSDVATQTIVAMHAMPYTDQFNNNIAPYFQQEISSYPNLLFCVCGHTHSTTTSTPFNDNITYYTCGAIIKREYLLFTIDKKGGINYEIVSY